MPKTTAKTTARPMAIARRARFMASSFYVSAQLRACESVRAETLGGRWSALGERKRGDRSVTEVVVRPPCEEHHSGRRSRRANRGQRDANLVDRRLKPDQQPPERKGAQHGYRQLPDRAHQEQVRHGCDRRAGRHRLGRFLHREKGKLDGEQAAKQAHIKWAVRDCAAASSGGKSSDADEQQAPQYRRSAEAEACLDQRRKVGMSTGALHALRRRAELQLVNQQVSHLR